MLSIFDMFTIGIGPSSSHTVGPMRAGKAFARSLENKGLLNQISRIHVTLYGSLSRTGKGHGTDRAVAAGLEGCDPETADTNHVLTVLDECDRQGKLTLAGSRKIPFSSSDIEFDFWTTLPYHPNGMKLEAYGQNGQVVFTDTVYSVGGGFIVHQADIDNQTQQQTCETAVPYPFTSATDLVDICRKESQSIADIVWANELALRPESQIREYADTLWTIMQECVKSGCHSQQKILPGGLNVPRRAPGLYTMLKETQCKGKSLIHPMEWVDLYALAVNEENASGGRIVTAPTNGAAGIVPAVLHYYWNFVEGANSEGVMTFLLTACAIGYLFKTNASISGAEVGCQGEVGSACSMAAAGLCAVMGGSPQQVENAAEIGIEHNLGLTCDPVGGLVQIPCIERNAMAANTAINAAHMALLSDGSHLVSLDSAIETMKQTGHDMMAKYKETSQGGLAVNVVEC